MFNSSVEYKSSSSIFLLFPLVPRESPNPSSVGISCLGADEEDGSLNSMTWTAGLSASAEETFKCFFFVFLVGLGSGGIEGLVTFGPEVFFLLKISSIALILQDTS